MCLFFFSFAGVDFHPLTCVSSRMLWTEYPQEPATFAIDDEFLVGEYQMFFFPS